MGGTAPSLSPHLHPRLPRPAPGIVTVEPGTRFSLASVDPDATGGLDKAEAKVALAGEHARIKAWQEKLYAEHRRSLLVVFQAIDTGGKDGTIRSVLEGVNPQGCRSGRSRCRARRNSIRISSGATTPRRRAAASSACSTAAIMRTFWWCG